MINISCYWCKSDSLWWYRCCIRWCNTVLIDSFLHVCPVCCQAWQKARSDGWERSFCEKNFLSQATMDMILGMRTQLLGQLRAIGQFHFHFISILIWLHQVDLTRTILNVIAFVGWINEWWAYFIYIWNVFVLQGLCGLGGAVTSVMWTWTLRTGLWWKQPWWLVCIQTWSILTRRHPCPPVTQRRKSTSIPHPSSVSPTPRR